jgi:prepilin-type N-terminal cleavage/methylation domain-containing protein
VSALLRRLRRDERGTTLMEMVVGMAIMAIFMSMFTTAVLMMTRTANKVESVTVSASQSNQGFLKLDKMVRYAAAISPPGAGTSGDQYVELRFTYTGSEQCTQLRFYQAKQQLVQRTWTVNAAGQASAASAWLPLASNVTAGSFTLPTSASALYQQLTVAMTTTFGNTQASTNATSMTFTALNSGLYLSNLRSNPGQTASVCGQQGRP